MEELPGMGKSLQDNTTGQDNTAGQAVTATAGTSEPVPVAVLDLEARSEGEDWRPFAAAARCLAG
ncbi:MAG: hypothetical protein ACYDH5_03525 [Acidimicrobiales bacterium]